MNILQLLEGLSGGRVMEDLDERLNEVLDAVNRTRKSGTVTLKIDLKPAKDSEVSQVGVFADVSGTIPHVERNREYFYVDRDGNLSRRDPRQPKPDIQLHDSLNHEIDRKSRAGGESA